MPAVLESFRSVKGRLAVKGSILFLFAASLALVFYWSSASTPKTNGSSLFEVKTTNFTRKLTQTGELRAFNSASIVTPKDGIVTYLIPEGTVVKAGEVLVRFDTTRFEIQLEENMSALRVAQADLRKAQTDLEVERVKQLSEIDRLDGEIQAVQLELDQMEKKRGLLRELADKGFITKSTFEENELTYLKTKIKLNQAKGALATAQKNSKPALESIQAGVARQKANVQRAEQLIASARVDIDNAVLRAPKAGLVVYAAVSRRSPDKVQEGMTAFRWQKLLDLPDVSEMVVDTEVNEIDVREITEGGPVNISVEAFPGETFHGTVLQIGYLATRKRDPAGNASRVKVFGVTVKVEEKDPRLRPGLTAAVDFIVDRRKDVVTVPVGAVHPGKDEQFVFVSTKGKVEKRQVVLGPSNENSVVVTEGLRPGELVVVGAPAS